MEVRKTRNGSLKFSLASRYYFLLHIQRKRQSLGSRALFILCILGVSSSCGRVRHYNINYGHAVARVSALQDRISRAPVQSPAILSTGELGRSAPAQSCIRILHAWGLCSISGHVASTLPLQSSIMVLPLQSSIMVLPLQSSIMILPLQLAKELIIRQWKLMLN